MSMVNTGKSQKAQRSRTYSVNEEEPEPVCHQTPSLQSQLTMFLIQDCAAPKARHAEAIARRGEKSMCRSHTRPGIGMGRLERLMLATFIRRSLRASSGAIAAPKSLIPRLAS
jgi:hypothetical protein